MKLCQTHKTIMVEAGNDLICPHQFAGKVFVGLQVHDLVDIPDNQAGGIAILSANQDAAIPFTAFRLHCQDKIVPPGGLIYRIGGLQVTQMETSTSNWKDPDELHYFSLDLEEQVDLLLSYRTVAQIIRHAHSDNNPIRKQRET
mgnify:CR=1 FL=1|jgi:hypothetical protein